MGRLEHDVEGYYHALGVSHKANAEDIKRAYKEKAKKYHPDLTDDPVAHELFIRVQTAYDILGDARKRRDYDKSHETPPPPPQTSPATSSHSRSQHRQQNTHFESGLHAYPGEQVQLVVCSETGEVTAQPRAVIFWSVVSLLFYYSRKAHYGVYSRRGADRAALKASLITWIFGFWGIPGCFIAFKALVSNMLGGEKPGDENAILLGEQAVAFSKLGKKDLARVTLDRAIAFARDRNIKTELLRFRQLLGPMTRPTTRLKDSWSIPASPAFWIQMTPLIMLCTVLGWFTIVLIGPFDFMRDIPRPQIPGAPLQNMADQLRSQPAPALPLVPATPEQVRPAPALRPPHILSAEAEERTRLAEQYPPGLLMHVPDRRGIPIYTEPGFNAARITSLPQFSTVSLLESPDLSGWVRVQMQNNSGGTEGYMRVSMLSEGSGTVAYERFCRDNRGEILNNGETLYRLAGTRGNHLMEITNEYGQPLLLDLRNRAGVTLIRVAVTAESRVTVTGVPDGLYSLTYATGEVYSRACQRFMPQMAVYHLNGNVQFSQIRSSREQPLPSHRFTIAPQGGAPQRSGTETDFQPY